jgi:hypothetical protein
MARVTTNGWRATAEQHLGGALWLTLSAATNDSDRVFLA